MTNRTKRIPANRPTPIGKASVVAFINTCGMFSSSNPSLISSHRVLIFDLKKFNAERKSFRILYIFLLSGPGPRRGRGFAPSPGGLSLRLHLDGGNALGLVIRG